MFCSTKHFLKDLNVKKKDNYGLFLEDYSNYTTKVVNHIWRYGYKEFSVTDLNLNIPKYIDYNDFNQFKTDLSARAKSSAVTQAAQIIKSSIEKQRRIIWIQNNKNPNAKDKPLTKPKLTFVKPNLSSKCCDFKFMNKGKFLGVVRLKSIGSVYGTIKIPLVKHKKCEGNMKNGFLFHKYYVQTVWDKPTTKHIKGDKIIAIDQGMIDVVTCSDEQKIPNKCNHGHSLKSIINKLSNKKKGSKAFNRTQHHRKNFVNWSINQINFENVKEVRLEKIVNIRFKRNTSRKMTHWSNPEIRDKIKRRCEELEVPVVEQSCAYRSQRCNQCGQVRKSIRKGKQYNCFNCGYCVDADYNASLNHLTDLPDVPKGFLGQKLNLGNGFFWNPTGFSLFDGSEIRVPNSYTKE